MLLRTLECCKQNYNILGPLFPEAPSIIYRGAFFLKLQVAPNGIDPPMTPMFFQAMKVFSLVANVGYVN